MLSLKAVNGYGIHICLLIICLLFVAGVLFCFHYGLMTEVRIKTSKTPFGKMTIAYRFSRGSYSRASQLYLESRCIMPNYPRIGIFYGDKKDAHSPLSFAIGAILNREGTPPDEKLKTYLDSYGYHFFVFPEMSYAVTGAYPFKNSLSLFFAVSRMYPKIASYVASRNLCAHPVIEIYGPSEIVFAVPLSRQNEFYVPEAEDLYSGSTENGFAKPMLSEASNIRPVLPLDGIAGETLILPSSLMSVHAVPGPYNLLSAFQECQ